MAAALALAIAGTAAITWRLATPARLKSAPAPSRAPEPFAAAAHCADTGLTIADAGQTLLLDGTGEEDFTGMRSSDLSCVLEVLRTPQAVREHMWDTRALDGRQEDSWPGFTASWSYHPDDGMDMVIRAAA
ncbi:hypothetical protein [Actinoplanes sp. N902-109]|uniref:hypothetical protein n=1 Tax=Actinoplanes sp. (strain N902-109) TaxID=649831 RepID=UPI0003295C9C|nr:hypothetical protein [Actinoplanes sp. N902-109]AGL13903.1 hypothetical protein L083_0393 [Actinoplanes sp. N902-109]